VGALQTVSPPAPFRLVKVFQPVTPPAPPLRPVETFQPGPLFPLPPIVGEGGGGGIMGTWGKEKTIREPLWLALSEVA